MVSSIGNNKQKGSKKGGGSVLKRLKSNLKDLGLIGPQKKSGASNKGTKAGDGGRDTILTKREKLAKLHNRISPFELKVNRQKHQVLNRVVKGSVGKPMISRKKGYENRSKTLLQEHNQKDKVSSFTDRRFGENDSKMTAEEKMLARFAKEKRRKSELYNLADGSDGNGDSDYDEAGFGSGAGGLLGEDLNDFQLTHSGKRLSEYDDARLASHDPRLNDTHDGEGYGAGGGADNIDASIVRDYHFGGFAPSDQQQQQQQDDPNYKPKTFKDVMHEVMAKSKYHKMLRQKEQEENEDMVFELNEEVDDIRDVLHEASQKRLAEQEQSLQATTSKKSENEIEDYDMFVKELTFEKRARPTDRLKTEDELIKEEADRLRQLEEERRARMFQSSSNSKGVSGRKLDSAVVKGGDDLEINYQLSDVQDSEDEDENMEESGNALTYKDGKLMNAHELSLSSHAKLRIQKEQDLDTEEDDDEEEVDSEDDSDLDIIEDDQVDEDLGINADASNLFGGAKESENSSEVEFVNGEESDINEDATNHSESVDEEEEKNQQKELNKSHVPYVLECPESFAELLSLMAQYNVTDQEIALKRLKVLYHPSVNPNHGGKLELLLKMLVQLYDLKCKTSENDGDCNVLEELDMLASNIHDLALKYPDTMQKIAFAKLERMQKSLSKVSVALPSNLPASKYKFIVSQEHLMSAALLTKLYSMTDFYNAVGTPLYMIYAQWLNNLCHRVKNLPSAIDSGVMSLVLRECLHGLIICQSLYGCVSETKRFIPEVQNFSSTMITVVVSKYLDGVDLSECCPSFSNTQLKQQQRLSLDFASEYIENFDSPLPQLLMQKCPLGITECKSVLFNVSLQLLSSYASYYASKETRLQGDLADGQTLSDIFVHVPEVNGFPFQEVCGPVQQVLSQLQSKFKDAGFECRQMSTTVNEFTAIETGLMKVRFRNCHLIGVAQCTRLPLQLHKQKRHAVQKSLNPKFNEAFNPDRKYDPNAERAEAQKLRSLHAKEMKGAMRELRKDAAFLAKTRLEQIKEKDAEYNKMIKRVYGIIGNEVGEDRREGKKHKGD
ncbi:hypothetical protein MP228_007253 [Amoeboaphelidium protococcarum]|nr:hypothetical protein MP228_007253 [Amoeboaphelidium protococcarum]